ncbi:Selenide, water dikinase [Emticicia oligotrophica DSM 17448]|uniref:Selenide, water dikinase n=1 Tax=Emticicia oligotrophica (strain DSM 17448 / CIP 109782 / MTCC 6937 / GPTSA100-15) TaxID=929562 RepID=A0ABM5N3D8_EMTOG|nr:MULTISPECIES: selenide, water dikinase SelD [Emticicia]AFK03848.1 Selenide, water dikinase [Emticicia oligotrophica DSM 17448]
MTEIKLTQYSHGSGCGCKISPKVLDQILHTISPQNTYPNLLVGNKDKDDAAVFDMGNGDALISTTDFFMPIVDDAFDFGRVASTNALSDVYAMGGEPLMAIAILGWPVDTIPPEIAQKVLDGSRATCTAANIPLAGGHSIDSPEPFFGLAVTGRVKIEHLKQNSTATEGCLLYLTKPLGVGLLTTAQKMGISNPENLQAAVEQMTTLNKVGASLGKLSSVKAMTDVTGFGLLGHLLEMCEGSHLSAEISYDRVPKIAGVTDYLYPFCAPKGCNTNWDSYKEKVSVMSDTQKILLADPQTSGGLLIAVEPSGKEELERILEENGILAESFGQMIAKTEKSINVI